MTTIAAQTSYTPLFNADGNVTGIQLTDASGAVLETREIIALNTLSAGIAAVKAQDNTLAMLWGQMEEQTTALNDINDILQTLGNEKKSLQDDAGKTGASLDADTVAKLKELAGKHGLQLGDIDLGKELSISDLESLQSNLATTQSSVGALNEDMSLKLNQAASQRSAVFTQLQTLLQTMMQTLQQLSRA
ncbi:MAG: hypothetical protein LBV80_05940 [Deltaproteobacteria bacterium]|jgi:hypothetical protein|nr:hypothetical protein [Deltaproteobacteria bacterium]